MTDLLFLIISGIVVAGWLEKRSSILSIAHTVYFVVFLVISLISTDVPFIAHAVENVIDEQALVIIRDAIAMPTTTLSFTFSVVMFIEMITSFVMLIIAAVCVVKVIERVHKQIKISEEVGTKKVFSAYDFSEITSNVPIYLRLRHLLN